MSKFVIAFDNQADAQRAINKLAQETIRTKRNETDIVVPRIQRSVSSPGSIPINVTLTETLVEGGMARATAKSVTSLDSIAFDGVVYAPSLGFQVLPIGTNCLVTKATGLEVYNHVEILNFIRAGEPKIYQLIYGTASSPKATLPTPVYNQSGSPANTLVNNLGAMEGTQMFVKMPNETEFTVQTSPFAITPNTHIGISEAYNDNEPPETSFNRSPLARYTHQLTLAEFQNRVTVQLDLLDQGDPQFATHYKMTINAASSLDDFEINYALDYYSYYATLPHTTSTRFISRGIYQEPIVIPKRNMSVSPSDMIVLYVTKPYPPFVFRSNSYTLPWPTEPT